MATFPKNFSPKKLHIGREKGREKSRGESREESRAAPLRELPARLGCGEALRVLLHYINDGGGTEEEREEDGGERGERWGADRRTGRAAARAQVRAWVPRAVRRTVWPWDCSPAMLRAGTRKTPIGMICTIQVSHMNTLLVMDSVHPVARLVPGTSTLHSVEVNPATAQADPNARSDMIASL